MRFDLVLLLPVRMFVEYGHGRVGKNARRPRVARCITPVNIGIKWHGRACGIWEVHLRRTHPFRND